MTVVGWAKDIHLIEEIVKRDENLLGDPFYSRIIMLSNSSTHSSSPLRLVFLSFKQIYLSLYGTTNLPYISSHHYYMILTFFRYLL
jgi:hypothetical protein